MASIEEISRYAAVDCVDIYNDFSEEEVNKMTTSIQSAWSTGARLVMQQQFLDSQSSANRDLSMEINQG